MFAWKKADFFQANEKRGAFPGKNRDFSRMENEKRRFLENFPIWICREYEFRGKDNRADLLPDAIRRSQTLYAEEQEKLYLSFFMICDIRKLGDDE